MGSRRYSIGRRDRDSDTVGWERLHSALLLLFHTASHCLCPASFLLPGAEMTSQRVPHAVPLRYARPACPALVAFLQTPNNDVNSPLFVLSFSLLYLLFFFPSPYLPRKGLARPWLSLVRLDVIALGMLEIAAGRKMWSASCSYVWISQICDRDNNNADSACFSHFPFSSILAFDRRPGINLQHGLAHFLGLGNRALPKEHYGRTC
jgi:hypothetical protein